MDVAVLSSQKLTALRDVIKCEADANMTSQGQARPNGYFYIEVSYTRACHLGMCVHLCSSCQQYCRAASWLMLVARPCAYHFGHSVATVMVFVLYCWVTV